MCIFCKIANGEIPTEFIYEDETVVAFLDIKPVSLGHTLILPKAHYETLETCPVYVLANLNAVAKQLSSEYANTYQTTSFNLLLNSGPASGQEIAHLHLHLIPRYAKGELTIKL